MEKLVNFYVQEAFAPETVMLCVAYVASRGKRTMGAVSHELKVWRAEGVETGEQADAHLQLLALRAQREQYVSGLLGIADTELTLGGRKAIARWYEVYGYDDAMVQEAAVQAGPKRDLWYWNSISRPGTPRACAPSTMCGARWPGWCQPEPPGGPHRAQRKRFSQERCPPPSAPQKDGHACRIRSFYAYQTGTVSSRPAHGGSAAADRPRQCRGCPVGGGGRHPALRHAEDEVRVRGIRCALAGAAGKDRTEAAAALSKARQELTALLAASGRPADALEPKFTCKLCQDTGSVQGRTCTCVHKLMQGLRREEIEALSSLSISSFDTMELRYYPNTMDEKLGEPVRTYMGGLLEDLRSYAEEFDHNSESLMLFGNAGLARPTPPSPLRALCCKRILT